MDTKIHALQVGSYLWAKEHAAAAAELEQKLMGLAALTGKPLDVVREQVSELSRAARCLPEIIVSQLEYNHHYRMVQSTELPPAKASDRRTVHLNGKSYHWAAGLGGQLKLEPGESPW
jgi:hypothetical protein